jgi:hypothetical protein
MGVGARCGASVILVAFVVLGCRERSAAPSADSATPPGAPAVAASAPRTESAVAAPTKLPARAGTTVGTRPPATAPAASAAPKDSAATAHASTQSTPAASTAVAPAPAAEAPAPTPPPPGPSALELALARHPFENTERLEYQVKYGFLGVGSAVLEVLGLDAVRGTPAVHVTFTVKGGIRVYRVNDVYESWFDPATYSTLRAVQNIDEGSYDRERHFEFFPDRKTFMENDKPEAPTVADPLDEASFLFFLRSIPLEVGQTYEFARYFRQDKNPVRVVVVRKESVKVPAGQFNTIVVRPVIRTTGIFGEGGRAEVWFTDDSARTLVQLKSQLKFGSLNLYLRNRRPGVPWQSTATVASPGR